MTAVLHETARAIDLMERVEELERIAETLPERDDRRHRLLQLARKDLASAPPLRPGIAAMLLRLSEKTVRAWTQEGVLKRAESSSPRLLLDPERVHEVLHLIKDLRDAGKTKGLLDEVHRRLVDATWLDRGDLIESLEQMRRGEGVTRAAKLPTA